MKKHFHIIADSLSKEKFFFAPGIITTRYRYSAFRSLFYFILFIFCFTSCENDPRDIENWTKRAELKEEAKTIESYLSQSGVMKAKLTAPLMYRFQKDTIYTEF